MARPIVRLKDIAETTGFSVNTVSLALRDSARIPEPTRAVIRQAAEALNYLPNHIAKSLVSRQTHSIGLVLTSITNPVLNGVAQAIELRLSELGYTTLFATSNGELDKELKAIEMFRARQVDGMLIYPRSHRQLDHIRRVRQAGYPVVLLVGDEDAGIDVVGMDTRLGSYKATRHLLEQGHRRIGLMDGGSGRGNLEKREGHAKALAEAGLSWDADLLFEPGPQSVAAGHRGMGQLMSRNNGMTAVLAATDSLALGALNWASEHALRVPDDMAIVGFDNIEYAEHATTPITTVDYAVAEVTSLAVERLMCLMRGEAQGDPVVTQIAPQLLIRKSSLKS